MAQTFEISNGIRSLITPSSGTCIQLVQSFFFDIQEIRLKAGICIGGCSILRGAHLPSLRFFENAQMIEPTTAQAAQFPPPV